jgi:hypothetical protein
LPITLVGLGGFISAGISTYQNIMEVGLKKWFICI